LILVAAAGVGPWDALIVPLREYGTSLGRPEVDTLNGSAVAALLGLRHHLIRLIAIFGG